MLLRIITVLFHIKYDKPLESDVNWEPGRLGKCVKEAIYKTTEFLVSSSQREVMVMGDGEDIRGSDGGV